MSNSNLRTPLARVRGLGSAKSGTGHFWHQRLTAIANIPLTIGFITPKGSATRVTTGARTVFVVSAF